MIPERNELKNDIKIIKQPSYTYEISNDRCAGKCDKVEAVQQAVYKILNTERYDNVIYSWGYGVQLKSLIGRPATYCIPEIERRIREALMMDDRINKVYDFTFERPQKGVIHCTFTIDTEYGTMTMGKEVKV